VKENHYRIPALLVLLACLLAVGTTFAARIDMTGPGKGPRQTAARPSTEYRVHDVGNFWTAISNFGNYGEPNALLPSGEWPGGSGVYYIWEGRFWAAALVGGEPLCSHADYGNYELDPSDGSTFYFGTGPKSIQDGLAHFDDLNGDIGGHTPIGLKFHQRSLAWSLNDYDDFIIVLLETENVSGGALNGVMVTYVFDNDVGAEADPTEPHIDDLVDYDGWAPQGENPYQYDIVDPLDLDGNGETGYDYWGWPNADPRNPFWNGYSPMAGEPEPTTDQPEPDGIWDEYQIYIVNAEDYTNVGWPVPDYIRYHESVSTKGYVAGEPVVTATGDSLRGYLIPRGMSYMYDGDFPQSGENDTGERMMSPDISGFIGTRFLHIPDEPYNNAKNRTQEDEWEPAYHPHSHQWWNWESDPGSDREKYEYMEGKHALSQGQRFMPHPFDYGAGAPVFDYRYMISSGPHSFADGETKKYVMVTGVGKGLEGLRRNLDNAIEAYYRGELPEIGDPMNPPDLAFADQYGFVGVKNSEIINDRHFLLPIPPTIPDLHYSALDGGVEMVWDDGAERAIDSFLGATDFEGYKVYRSKYNPQTWEMIAAFDYSHVDETYLYNTEGGIINPIWNAEGEYAYNEAEWNETVTNEELVQGTDWDYIMVDLPDLVHGHEDFGGDFWNKDSTTVIFRDIERPVNGLKYFYSVVAYDPDKMAQFGLPSIESAKSNYRKDLGGAPEPVIPRPERARMRQEGLDNVQVVPNPYKGTALFEAKYEDQICFINLPARCKISIFSLSGDLIDEMYKDEATTGAMYWDLISRNNQKVVSGLYVYIVETPGGDKKVGKFLIIR